MLRVVRIRLARCTLYRFQASRTRTLRLLSQRQYNRGQQRDSSSSNNNKQLQQPRLSRAPAWVQKQVPPCLATSLRRVSNARTRCRIRTDPIVLRMERWRDRSALDLEDPVWPLMLRGIRRLPLRRRRRRHCGDSLRRCVWASLVSARDRRDEVGRFKVIGRTRAADSPLSQQFSLRHL
jgi:hypothetical protein